mmetsp:Transcript_19640/g.51634  ORF Transcript_19640/g.51634 Transcript_19640/m.51634 type:complete len:162 (-) Transcript_19640:513-998(-)
MPVKFKTSFLQFTLMPREGSKATNANEQHWARGRDELLRGRGNFHDVDGSVTLTWLPGADRHVDPSAQGLEHDQVHEVELQLGWKLLPIGPSAHPCGEAPSDAVVFVRGGVDVTRLAEFQEPIGWRTSGVDLPWVYESDIHWAARLVQKEPVLFTDPLFKS